MSELSDADLAAIEARANAATPGLWTAQSGRYDDLHFGDCGPAAGVTGEHLRGFYVPGFRREDAEFIAHARTDVPALLAALVDARSLAGDLTATLTDAGLPPSEHGGVRGAVLLLIGLWRGERQRADEAAWDARQQAIQECRTDLATALGYDADVHNSWSGLIENAGLLAEIARRHR